MRVLGIDYGTKKIGMALGDTDLRIASPLDVWRHTEDEAVLMKRLTTFVREEDVEMIVVGVPKKRSGEDTEQGGIHRTFVALLEEQLDCPVVTVDESFTSKESQRLQAETGSEASEDALAAMLILQEYFETL